MSAGRAFEQSRADWGRALSLGSSHVLAAYVSPDFKLGNASEDFVKKKVRKFRGCR